MFDRRDIIHDGLGHVPMLADERYASMLQRVALAAYGASPADQNLLRARLRAARAASGAVAARVRRRASHVRRPTDRKFVRSVSRGPEVIQSNLI